MWDHRVLACGMLEWCPPALISSELSLVGDKLLLTRVLKMCDFRLRTDSTSGLGGTLNRADRFRELSFIVSV